MWSRILSIKRVSLLAVLLLLGAGPVRANEESDWVKALKGSPLEPGSMNKSGQKSETSSNDDAATINGLNPTDLRSHASAHLKDGDIESAIKLVERAIELQPEDTDGRQIYADALEQKLKAQVQRDPHTFNQCVKQWYFLYKNSEYPEMGNLAAKHLKDLTGRSPYMWPAAKMYLGKVLMAEIGNDGANATISEEPTQIH